MKAFKILLIVALSAVVLGAKAQKNLVENGGFEDEFYGWNQGNAKLTPWDLKSGKSSCAIVTPNADNWVGIDQIIRIPKKAHTIEFSAWIKTINVVKGKNDWDGAIFTISFLDGAERGLGVDQNIARITGDQGWTLSSAKIKMPEKAASFKILIAMGNASGTLIVDDVAARVID